MEFEPDRVRWDPDRPLHPILPWKVAGDAQDEEPRHFPHQYSIVEGGTFEGNPLGLLPRTRPVWAFVSAVPRKGYWMGWKRF